MGGKSRQKIIFTRMKHKRLPIFIRKQGRIAKYVGLWDIPLPKETQVSIAIVTKGEAGHSSHMSSLIVCHLDEGEDSEVAHT
jgi:pyridoxal biosynthesis lyase PdxS